MKYFLASCGYHFIMKAFLMPVSGTEGHLGSKAWGCFSWEARVAMLHAC